MHMYILQVQPLFYSSYITLPIVPQHAPITSTPHAKTWLAFVSIVPNSLNVCIQCLHVTVCLAYFLILGSFYF